MRPARKRSRRSRSWCRTIYQELGASAESVPAIHGIVSSVNFLLRRPFQLCYLSYVNSYTHLSLVGTNKIGFVSCRHLPKKIPAKYRKAGARIRSSFGNMVKRDERSFLLKLAGVKSLAEIELLIKSIPSVSLLLRYRSCKSISVMEIQFLTRNTGLFFGKMVDCKIHPTMRGGIRPTLCRCSRLCIFIVWSLQNKEVAPTAKFEWGTLELKLFLLHFRTERHTTPSDTWNKKKIKKIEEKEKEVKVDLLLFTKVYGDIFAYEYKPTDASENDIQSDVRKRQQLLI